MSNNVNGRNEVFSTSNPPTNIIDLLSLIKGSRFAVTFLDYAKKELAINDEVMLDKLTGQFYYKDKNGTIRTAGGSKVPEQLEERLVKLEEGIDILARETKEYVDSVFSEASIGTSYKMVNFQYTISVTEVRSTFKIPLQTFKKDRDFLLVTSNVTVPSPDNPTLGYTVDNDRNITFKTEFQPGDEIYLVIFKNVPVGSEDAFDGYYIKNGTIGTSKLDATLQRRLKLLEDIEKEGGITFDMLHPDVKKAIEEGGGNDGGGGTDPSKVIGVIPGSYVTSSSTPLDQKEGETWFKLPDDMNFAPVKSEGIEVGDKDAIVTKHGEVVLDSNNK